ncbi:MAG: AMP-binding protein, partial [Candidatus Rokuibacteriota bacterium]
MRKPEALHELFLEAAGRWPEHTAVVDPGHGAITYRELATLSDRLRDRLAAMGVRPGDRVGICLRKSIDAVAAIHGILKTGAAYVPVDPGAPPARNAYIMHNCAVKAIVMESRFGLKLQGEFEPLGKLPAMLLLDSTGDGTALRRALDSEDAERPAPVTETVLPAPGDLAYILYTSGSTGKPKGVMLSHENGVSFVDWCSEV